MHSHIPKILFFHARVVAMAVGLTAAFVLPPAAAVPIPDWVIGSSVAASPSATVTLKVRKQISDQTQVQARVAVVSAGRLTAGTFLVRQGSRTLAKKAVAGGTRLSAMVTLPRLAVGKHYLYGVFRTSTGSLGRSPAVVVTSHRGCGWRPASCGYPGTSSTGPAHGTHFRSVPGDVRRGKGWHYDPRGWVEIDTKGAVFSGFVLSHGIVITADNVTVSNNTLNLTSGDWGVSLRHATGVTIDRNIIRGPSGTSPCDNGIRDIYGDANRVRITRNNIYYCASGINHFDEGGLIRNNYIHHLGHPCRSGDVDCGHFNGIQLGAGYGPLMTIDHNTIFNPARSTDAIMLANDDGAQTNRAITDNLLAGGGYTFYGSGGPAGKATNIVFQGNRFSTQYFRRSGFFGPVAHWQAASGNKWSGNTWDDGPHAGKTVRP